MHSVNQIWQVETKSHVFEYNMSETTNVFEAHDTRDSIDVDIWTKRYDSREDFSRDCSLWLEELQEGAWIVAENTTGYLPDGEPAAFAEYRDALTALCETMQEWAEHDDEKWEYENEEITEDNYPSSDAWAESVIHDLERESPDERELTFTVQPNDPREFSRVFTLSYDPEQEVNVNDIP